MKDQSQRLSFPCPNFANPVAHGGTMISPGATARPLAYRDDGRGPLKQDRQNRPRLHTGRLFDQHEFAACEIPARDA